MACNSNQISSNCWEGKNYILRFFLFAVNSFVVVFDQTPFFKFEYMAVELEYTVLKVNLIGCWDTVLDD